MTFIQPDKQHVEIGAKQVGKIIPTEFGLFYVDVARDFMNRTKKVFLLIDEKGNIEPVLEGAVWKGKYVLHSESEGIPPATNLFSFDEIINAPDMSLKDAYESVKEVLQKTVYFHSDLLYDLVVSWCAYTWLRGLFPKNINLYFLGFPATGKSQALKFIKNFARYVVDYDPLAQKSYKWAIHHSLGVLAIDEAEYLTKTTLARLRKFHETEVYEQRVIGLPLVGLTSIDLRVDAPVVISATHVPPDPAFMQRGLIIRMVKGNPEIKDFSQIPILEELRRAFAKAVLTNWKKIFESLTFILEYSHEVNVDERIKDVAIPFATILHAIGGEYQMPYIIALFSFKQATYTTIQSTVFAMTVLEMKKELEDFGNCYRIPIKKVLEILDRVGRSFGIHKEKMLNLLQYFFAGGKIRTSENELYYYFDKGTFDNLVRYLEV